MSGGGGGGSGDYRYNWSDAMAPYWGGALQNATNLAQKPYQPYTGQRIADINYDQNAAASNVRQFLGGEKNPVGAVNAAIDQTTNTLNGGYMPGTPGGDPYAGKGGVVETNAFSGENPYFKQSLANSLDEAGNAYKNTTAADTTRMFNLAGAFGGSAHENAVANNENALAKQMGNIANTAFQQQYDRSAGLRENDINRNLQNDQFGLASGTNAYNNERGRQMGAIGLGNDQQGLAFQRGAEQMGIGDMYRSYNQDLLNQQYGDWQTQQNYPFTMADWLTGTYSRAQGGMSPNSSFTQSGYSASPYSQLLGAGLLGYGLTK